MPEPSYQHDIFLSYASEDRERVKLLANTLASLGWFVWWDRRIPTGKRFAKVIEEQLDTSRTVVVVWSKISVHSDWVHTEAAEGLRRDALFPVLIGKVTIPLEFRRVQAADLIHWQGDQKDDKWELLIDDLTAVLGPPRDLLQPLEIKEQKALKPSSATRGKPKSVPMDKRRTKPKGKPTTTLRVKRGIPDGMALIPKGLFLYEDEKQKVTIDHDYYMDVHPVTNAAYRKFTEAGGYENQAHWSEKGWNWRTTEKVPKPKYLDDDSFNHPDHPVVGVNYYEAEAYAKWAGKLLPTEQEWEKAARGTDGRVYPWGEEFDAGRCACSVKGKRERTTPIGTFPEGKSPYGSQDMAGNVWEWCASWYDQDKDSRVLRGDTYPEVCRCAYRDDDVPWDRYSSFGFRCAQDAP